MTCEEISYKIASEKIISVKGITCFAHNINTLKGYYSELGTHILDGLIVEFGFKLLVVSNLSYSFHEVFLNYPLTLGANSKDTSFCAHIAKICTVECV